MTTENTENQSSTIDWNDEAARTAEIEKLVGGLKNKNSELLAKHKEYQAKESEWKNFQTEKETLEQRAEEERMKKAGEFEKLRERDRGEWSKKEQELNAAATKYKTALETKVLEVEALSAISELNGSPKLLMNYIKENVRLEETDDGNLKVVVLDDAKLPTEKTIKQFLTELSTQDEFAGAFKSNKATGGGATSPSKTGTSSNTVNPFKKESWNYTEQARLYAHDRAKYDLLKREAGA